MSGPASALAKAKWLPFFSELSAKITHHNAAVVLEGCALLERLLLTHVSVAALLQEGALLQSVADVLVGTVGVERTLDARRDAADSPAGAPSAVLGLHTDVVHALLGVVSFAADMMLALFQDAAETADGDAAAHYYRLLVLSRAGLLADALGRVLHRAPSSPFFGLCADILARLLTLPLGDAAGSEASAAAPAAAAHQSGGQPDRVQLAGLAAAVSAQGRLLGTLSDALTAVAATCAELEDSETPAAPRAEHAATTTPPRTPKSSAEAPDAATSVRSDGADATEEDDDDKASDASAVADVKLFPQRYAALRLINLVAERRAAATGDDGAGAATAATPEPSAPLPRATAASSEQPTEEQAEGEEEGGDGEDAEADYNVTLHDRSAEGSSSHARSRQWRAAADVSSSTASAGGGRNEPAVAYRISDFYVETVFKALEPAQCDSHEAFLRGLSGLWCVRLADPAAFAARFTPAYFRRCLQRFLTRPPNTRADYAVFSQLLLFWGPLCRRGGAAGWDASPPLPGESPQQSVAAALVAVLWAEEDKKDLAQAAASGGVASSISAGPLFGPRAHGDTPPRAAAAPSTTLAVLAFLAGAAHPGLSPHVARALLLPPAAGGAGLLTALERVVRRVEGRRGVAVESATRFDGSLSDEVYLSEALQASGRDDHAASAALACRLAAALLYRHAPRALEPGQPAAAAALAEVRAFAQVMSPLLLTVSLRNPTVSLPALAPPTGRWEEPAASALLRGPAGVYAARAMTLGEAAATALDACLHCNAACRLQALPLSALLPRLAELRRATAGSVARPLRALACRCLLYMVPAAPQLALVCAEMPDCVRAAMRSLAAYPARGTDPWEAAAAAEWLLRVVAVATAGGVLPPSPGAGIGGGEVAAATAELFSDRAAPQRIAEAAVVGLATSGGRAEAPTTVAMHAAAALLTLAVSLRRHHQRGASATAEAGRSAEDDDLGGRGGRRWLALLAALTPRNHALARLAAAAALPYLPQGRRRRSHDDAAARALAAGEAVAAQYGLCAALARRLSDTLAAGESSAVAALLAARPSHAQAQRQSAAVAARDVTLDFVCSLYGAPVPAEVAALVARRSGGDVDASLVAAGLTGLPEQHAKMMDAAAALAQAWERAAVSAAVGDSAPRPPEAVLPRVLVAALAERMRDDRLPLRCRGRLPILVSAVLAVADACDGGGGDAAAITATATARRVRAPVAAHAVALFQASLHLSAGGGAAADADDGAASAAAAAMQCRLLSAFAAPPLFALRDTPWMDTVVARLAAAVASSPSSPAEAAPPLSPEVLARYAADVSLLSCAVGSPACPSLSEMMSAQGGAAQAPRQRVACALIEGLRRPATRTLTLRALLTCVRRGSAEGRQLLLHEICGGHSRSPSPSRAATASASSSPSSASAVPAGGGGGSLSRTLFGCLLSLTLEIPSLWMRAGEGGGGGGGQHGRRREQQEQQRIGMQVCTQVCGGAGGEAFLALLQRHRGLEYVGKLLVHHFRPAARARGEHSPAARLGVLRLLAAVSLHADAQKRLLTLGEALSIVIEVAGGVCEAASAAAAEEAEERTLALLLLRNLCFAPASKPLVCQDARILLTLKAALLRLPRVDALITHTELRAHAPSPSSASPASAAAAGRIVVHCAVADEVFALSAASRGAAAGARALGRERSPFVEWANHVAYVSQVRQQQAHNSAAGGGRHATAPLTDSTNINAAAAAAGKAAARAAGELLLAQERQQQQPQTEEEAATDPWTQTRADLARSALQALLFDNQRGKNYVRTVLESHRPVVDAASLSPLAA